MRMKTLAGVIVAAAMLSLAQQAALQESSVKLGRNTVSIKYPAIPSSAAAGLSAAQLILHTDADLEIQGLPVPKGDYALYLQPGPQQWELIINKQAGGARNPKLDLGRVPMDMKKAASPSPVLKVTLAGFGNVAGRMDVAFGATLASAPFNIDAVKPNAEW